MDLAMYTSMDLVVYERNKMYTSMDLAVYERCKELRTNGLNAVVSKETWEKRKQYQEGASFDTIRAVVKDGGVLLKPLKVVLDDNLQPVKDESPVVVSDLVPFIFDCPTLGLVVVEFDSKSGYSNSSYDKLSIANALWKTLFVSAVTGNQSTCRLLYCYKAITGYTSVLCNPLDQCDFYDYENMYKEFVNGWVSLSLGEDIE